MVFFFLAFVWLGLGVDAHWFVVALLGGAVMGGCGVIGVLYHGFGGVFGLLGDFLMRELGSQGRWG